MEEVVITKYYSYLCTMKEEKLKIRTFREADKPWALFKKALKSRNEKASDVIRMFIKKYTLDAESGT
jgi:hypothetical protein